MKPRGLGALLLVVASGVTSTSRADKKFDEMLSGAAPAGGAFILAPFFDGCRAGNEFEQRRCKLALPARRDEARKTTWVVSLKGERSVEVGTYDFNRHTFSVTAKEMVLGPVGGVDGADAWLTSLPIRDFAQPRRAIKKWTVKVPLEMAEAWKVRNGNLSALQLEIIFKIGDSWSTTTSVGKRFDFRQRKLVNVSRKASGMTIKPLAMRVVNIDTGEVVSEAPGAALARAPRLELLRKEIDRCLELDKQCMAKPDDAHCAIPVARCRSLVIMAYSDEETELHRREAKRAAVPAALLEALESDYEKKCEKSSWNRDAGTIDSFKCECALPGCTTMQVIAGDPDNGITPQYRFSFDDANRIKELLKKEWRIEDNVERGGDEWYWYEIHPDGGGAKLYVNKAIEDCAGCEGD